MVSIAPRPLYPRKMRSSNPLYSIDGLRAGLDATEVTNIIPLPESISDYLIVQSVACLLHRTLHTLQTGADI
jgi:hypothetical protein